MKYFMITYGCQMNAADSEEMGGALRERGLAQARELQDADVVLVNTCTVRENAEHKADSQIGRLRRWKAQHAKRVLIVTGCAATQWGDTIRRKYPFIDLVSPATRIEQFPELVEEVLGRRFAFDDEERLWGPVERMPSAASALPGSVPPAPLEALTPPSVHPFAPPPLRFSRFGTDRTGYVTIMRGCNLSCAYCIVPQVRGREIYRPMEDILGEVRAKVARGYREIMLLGQTVNSYRDRIGAAEPHRSGGGASRTPSRSERPGSGGGGQPAPAPGPGGREAVAVRGFSDLLRAVDAIEGVETLRFMSPHPRHFLDDQVAAMAECRTIARHVHLPVQSGSNAVLSRMRRRYSREDYLALAARLRRAMPSIQITTDLLVGFCGETEQDFEDTLRLMRRVRFDAVFAFKYSPRPGTPAALWPDDVPAAVKEARLQRVLALARDAAPRETAGRSW